MNCFVKRLERTEQEMKNLERLCESWGFWAFESVCRIFERKGALIFYVEHPSHGSWQGVVIATTVCDTTDLLYIYVDQFQRNAGMGSDLLNTLVEHLRQVGGQKKLLLEVRVSNLAARTFYEKFGMIRIDCRKKYYQNGEDAFVYQFDLEDDGREVGRS